jgi:RNA polymerase sigma-70 factor, ECF subfamily
LRHLVAAIAVRRDVVDHEWLANQFEAHRARLRAVAYRMLGSLSEADDAVQESWLRLSRSNADGIENLTGWLTTVVARVSLTMLRSRRLRREEPFDVRVPDPIVSRVDAGLDPEQAALLSDSVSLALLVILETLTPDERLAFVLHDMFAMPFDEIAPIVGRSPVAARQLASRARRRVRGKPSLGDTDVARHREAVEAFLTAARAGDFDALVAVLDSDVVLRADQGTLRAIRGARAVAEGAVTFARIAQSAQIALVNGAPGIVGRLPDGQPMAVLGFAVSGGKIVEIDILADPARLRQLDLRALED